MKLFLLLLLVSCSVPKYMVGNCYQEDMSNETMRAILFFKILNISETEYRYYFGINSFDEVIITTSKLAILESRELKQIDCSQLGEKHD